MNNSTFLITNRDTFSIKHTRIGLIVIGSLMLAYNFLLFLDLGNPVNLNPFVAFLGVSFLISGTVGLSEKSKYAPKVSLTNEFISIKEKLWSSSHTYNWAEIEEVTLGSYQLIIKTKSESNTLNIDSTKQIAIAIKKAIRVFAVNKNIPIIGS